MHGHITRGNLHLNHVHTVARYSGDYRTTHLLKVYVCTGLSVFKLFSLPKIFFFFLTMHYRLGPYTETQLRAAQARRKQKPARPALCLRIAEAEVNILNYSLPIQKPYNSC